MCNKTLYVVTKWQQNIENINFLQCSLGITVLLPFVLVLCYIHQKHRCLYTEHSQMISCHLDPAGRYRKALLRPTLQQNLNTCSSAYTKTSKHGNTYCNHNLPINYVCDLWYLSMYSIHSESGLVDNQWLVDNQSSSLSTLSWSYCISGMDHAN